MFRIAMVCRRGIGEQVVGSDQRLIATVVSLLDLGCAVDFYRLTMHRPMGIGHILQRRPMYADRVRDQGSAERLQRGIGYDAVYLTAIWNLDRLVSDVVDRLAQALPLIVDSSDCITASIKQLSSARADATFQIEKALHQRAQCSVFVTRAECFKAASVLQINPAQVLEVGYALGQPLAAETPSYSERRHVAFLGNAANQHNLMAIRHFIERVYPDLVAKQPDLEVHILGAGMDKLALADPNGRHKNIRVIGFVDDLLNTLAGYRVVVAPLMSGGGMKIKIVDALFAATPVVTTIAGVEGMPLVHREHIIVAEQPSKFVEGVLMLYRNQSLWEAMSLAGFQQAAMHYNHERLHQQVAAVLKAVRQVPV